MGKEMKIFGETIKRLKAEAIFKGVSSMKLIDGLELKDGSKLDVCIDFKPIRISVYIKG